MTGREQGARRSWRGWYTAAIAAAVAVAVIAAVGSALAAPGATAAAAQVTDVSRTPAGWSPVPYKNAQLSVPGSSWLVEAPQQLSCGYPGISGMIFVGIKPGIPKDYECTAAANEAWILPAGQIPKGITHRKPTAVIGGIPVYHLSSGTGTTAYLVPELGVRIGARGKSAARVLATLTRSPLSVVLRRGAAARVPASWTWRQLGAARFAVPRSWSVQREDQWSTCGTGVLPSSLLLINATKPPFYLPCALQIPTASAYRAQPGLTVVTGKYAAQSVGERYGSCQSRRGVRICLSTDTGQGGFLSGVLIFSVSQPKHAATFFLLGLPGSGANGRAIFDSVRAA